LASILACSELFNYPYFNAYFSVYELQNKEGTRERRKKPSKIKSKTASGNDGSATADGKTDEAESRKKSKEKSSK